MKSVKPRPAQNVHDLLCYLISNTFLMITRHPQHIHHLILGRIVDTNDYKAAI